MLHVLGTCICIENIGNTECISGYYCDQAEKLNIPYWNATVNKLC